MVLKLENITLVLNVSHFFDLKENKALNLLADWSKILASLIALGIQIPTHRKESMGPSIKYLKFSEKLEFLNL